ncbi:MAG: DUF4838 domain-containing protein, partial [Lentisphaerae bacterium]|nr:DUF4838 domain-containing protein [Lentisphaerota bacterium]
IVGNDSPQLNPQRSAGWHERGTLNGVYDFLERVGGIKFYFPSEYGIIIPKRKDWSIPEISITDRPDSQYRRLYCVGVSSTGDKTLHMPEGMEVNATKRLTELRLRMSTLNIPNCHGLAKLGLVQRFGETHPEYFAIQQNGKRINGTNPTNSHEIEGQLCFTNPGLKEEIYQDAEAFLSGKPATSRNVLMPNGKVWWNSNYFSRPFFNIMPNDSNYRCFCPECAKVYEAGPQAISDHIWKFKTDIAKRLQDNNIPGYITVMAYSNYRIIPTMDIPSNMIVHLAVTGPWNEGAEKLQQRDEALLDAWNQKLGAKTYLWTYAEKVMCRIDGIPSFTPKAVGTFFHRNGSKIFGAFLEGEVDYWMFHFLNFYVFGKVMWDNSIDVEQLLDEHCRLMYGDGAGTMREIYSTLEKHWLIDIRSDVRETNLGFKAVTPSLHEIWTKIYSPEEMTRIGNLFDQAGKEASADQECVARVQFMRNALWQPVLDARKAYEKADHDKETWHAYMLPVSEKITIDGVLDEAAWKNAPEYWMIPRPGYVKAKDQIEVHTRIKMLCDEDNFYFGIAADEPHTDKMVGTERKKDEIELWKDNLVELFFASDRTSPKLYQIMLGSNGNVTDLLCLPEGLDNTWDSDLEYKPGVVPGKMWVAEVRIPRRSMPDLKGQEFVANFTRGRVLDGAEVVMPYYTWMPIRRQNSENCGTVTIGAVPENPSIVKYGDFAEPVLNKRFLGEWGSRSNWFGNKLLKRDTEIFRTAGAAMRLEGDENTVDTLTQYLFDLKPNTRYRLSFFARMEEVSKTGAVASGFYVNLRFGGEGLNQTWSPLPQTMAGTMDWRRFEAETTSPDSVAVKHKPYLQFNLRHAPGKVWIDHVELIEVNE